MLVIHALVDGHLHCIHLLAAMDNAVVNIHVQGSVQIYVLNSLGYTSPNGIIGSYYNSNLRNCQTVYHRVIPFTFLPAIYKGSICYYSLTNICYYSLKNVLNLFFIIMVNYG